MPIKFLPLYFCEASVLQRSQAQNYYFYNSIFRVEGGQSVTLVGSKLITSGGEHKHLILLNDVNSLDLETMIWNVAETTQVDLYNILATLWYIYGHCHCAMDYVCVVMCLSAYLNCFLWEPNKKAHLVRWLYGSNCRILMWVRYFYALCLVLNVEFLSVDW
ncbi:hypothetical protein Hanom_Chr14g01297961 [Helianthus anomalus]